MQTTPKSPLPPTFRSCALNSFVQSFFSKCWWYAAWIVDCMYITCSKNPQRGPEWIFPTTFILSNTDSILALLVWVTTAEPASKAGKKDIFLMTMEVITLLEIKRQPTTLMMMICNYIIIHTQLCNRGKETRQINLP